MKTIKLLKQIKKLQINENEYLRLKELSNQSVLNRRDEKEFSKLLLKYEDIAEDLYLDKCRAFKYILIILCANGKGINIAKEQAKSFSSEFEFEDGNLSLVEKNNILKCFA